MINFENPGSYEVIAVADTPIGLTAAKLNGPEGVRNSQALICVENYAIRWTADGTEPSATVGMPLAAGESMVLSGKQTLNNLKMHFVTSEASVKVHYWYQL
jgi:hypothetical protein